MVHCPADAFSNKYYLDSVLIPVPSFVNGRTDGKDIPVTKGYYSFQGSIAVKDGNLRVDLLINDTSDKIIRPLTWNGSYVLVIR